MTKKIYEQKGATERLVKLVPCKIKGIPQLVDAEDKLVKPYEATMLLVNTVKEMREREAKASTSLIAKVVVEADKANKELKKATSLITEIAAESDKAIKEVKEDNKKMKFRIGIALACVVALQITHEYIAPFIASII